MIYLFKGLFYDKLRTGKVEVPPIYNACFVIFGRGTGLGALSAIEDDQYK